MYTTKVLNKKEFVKEMHTEVLFNVVTLMQYNYT